MWNWVRTLVGFFLISLVLGSLGEYAFAQSSASAEASPPVAAKESSDAVALLKEVLDRACSENNLPALWAGKFYADGPSLVAASGTRKWNEPDPAEISDIVHLGSCTKAMTAAIIGQLCTEGKLRLDSSLGEVFAEVPTVPNSAWKDVTVTDLMQHRSGAPGNFPFHQFDEANRNSLVNARRSLLEHLVEKKRTRKPRFVYSNVGYTVLGHIVETVEGRPWEEIVNERIFIKLGIRSAGFGAVGKPDGVELSNSLPNRAWGHTESSGLVTIVKSLLGEKTGDSLVPIQIDNSPCIGPAGRVHMNLQDWSRFVVLYGLEEGYKELGISKEVWQSMLSPAENAKEGEAYNAGWVFFDSPKFGGKGYFHNGSNTTWYCYAVASPGKNRCILVATNVFSSKAQKACDDIARYLADDQ